MIFDGGNHLNSVTLVVMKEPEGPPHFTMHLGEVVVTSLYVVRDDNDKVSRMRLALMFTTGEITQGHTTWSHENKMNKYCRPSFYASNHGCTPRGVTVHFWGSSCGASQGPAFRDQKNFGPPTIETVDSESFQRFCVNLRGEAVCN